VKLSALEAILALDLGGERRVPEAAGDDELLRPKFDRAVVADDR
jgi:hypothetical protein